jgi:hypothetical protein
MSERKKKMVQVVVTDRLGVSWHRQLLPKGAAFYVDWNQSHSHVDRWLLEGRVIVIPRS